MISTRSHQQITGENFNFYEKTKTLKILFVLFCFPLCFFLFETRHAHTLCIMERKMYCSTFSPPPKKHIDRQAYAHKQSRDTLLQTYPLLFTLENTLQTLGDPVQHSRDSNKLRQYKDCPRPFKTEIHIAEHTHTPLFILFKSFMLH